MENIPNNSPHPRRPACLQACCGPNHQKTDLIGRRQSVTALKTNSAWKPMKSSGWLCRPWDAVGPSWIVPKRKTISRKAFRLIKWRHKKPMKIKMRKNSDLITINKLCLHRVSWPLPTSPRVKLSAPGVTELWPESSSLIENSSANQLKG